LIYLLNFCNPFTTSYCRKLGFYSINAFNLKKEQSIKRNRKIIVPYNTMFMSAGFMGAANILSCTSLSFNCFSTDGISVTLIKNKMIIPV